MSDDSSSGTKAPVIELEDVDIPATGVPETCIVPGVRWTVTTGQRWLVTGPSGAGKTSVLHVAAGLMRPARGRHRLFGEDLALLPERDQVARRIRVGIVFGGGGRLFPHLDVAENVALPLFYHAREREADRIERVAELLEALGLESVAKRHPRDLSRRWMQRVALARALALEPEVLLLDDPGAGLGPSETEWWQRFVRDCIAGRLAVCHAVRTLVVAAPEETGWSSLIPARAHVESGTWQAEWPTGQPT